jgi:hypothetical protein
MRFAGRGLLVLGCRLMDYECTPFDERISRSLAIESMFF